MTVERGSFAQRKNPEEIVNHAVGNSRYIEEVTGQPLIPPSFRDVHLLGSMSQQEVRAQFGTKRYGILLDFMRADLQARDLPEDRRQEHARWLQILNNVDGYIADHHAGENGRTLYPKQMEAFEGLARFLADGGNEGYFKLPTAFGKTVIFTEFVKAADVRTLIIVPTLEVVEQTGTSFERFAPEVEVGKVYQDERRFGEKTTVITYASLLRWLDERVPLEDVLNFRPYDIELLILDEAHHALGEKTAEALAQFPDAIKLGFTATPVYSRERHLGKLLNEAIYSMSIKEAVEEGILSPFRVWLAQTNIDISDVRVDNITGDYNPRQLARSVNIASRNKAAIDLYQEHFNGESALVNCVSVKHAQEVARLLRERGIKAEAIWGGLTSKKRSQIVEAYRKGEITVLCSDRVLTEGFDAPNASVCLNLKPTLSAVVTEQRGGRILRLDPNNPNKEATIIDFVDKYRGLYHQVSFAEVAETAGIPRKLQEQIGAMSLIGDRSDVKGGLSPAPIFDLGDMKVVTDVIEVMRISSEASMQREQILFLPEGYSRISITAIAQEIESKTGQVYHILKNLSEQHPELFYKTLGGRLVTSQEGIDLLKKSLEVFKIPEGYTAIQPEVFGQEHGFGRRTVEAQLRRLSLLHPEHFMRRGVGKATAASLEGIELLLNSLKALIDPEGWTRIIHSEWYKQYDMGHGTFTEHLNDLRSAHPDQFMRRAPGGAIFATPQGIALLQEKLAFLKPPEGFEEVNTRFLADEFHISRGTVITHLRELIETQPDLFINRGGTRSTFATIDGLNLLRTDLEGLRPAHTVIPEGYAPLPARIDLAGQYDLKVSTIQAQIGQARRTLPEAFIQRRNQSPLATPEGLELVTRLIRDFKARDNIRKAQGRKKSPITDIPEISETAFKEGELPEGFVLLLYSILSAESGVDIVNVGRHARRIMARQPEHFLRARKGQMNTYFADVDGVATIRDSLENLKKPVSFMELRTGELIEEFQADASVIYFRVRKLSEEYPGHFRRRGSRYVTLVTADGLKLLKESLSATRPPEGFVKFDRSELATEFGTTPARISSLLQTLSKSDPAHFIRGGMGGTNYITEQGRELIRARLAHRKVPEGYSRLNFAQLEEEVGAPKWKIVGQLTSLMQTNPDDVIRHGMNKPVYITERGMDLLKVSLQPRNQNRLPVSDLAEEFGVSGNSIRSYARRLITQYPDHIKREQKTGIFLATGEGIELLRKEVQQTLRPEGYIPISAPDIAAQHGVPVYLVHNYIKRLNEVHPNDVVPRGANKPIIVTPEGLELLKQEIEGAKPPGGYTEIETSELASEYGLETTVVSSRIRTLSNNNPSAIIRRGVGYPAIATEKGIELLKAALLRAQQNR